MRETSFRGKRVDNGEWVYGYYASKFRQSCHNEYHYIHTGDIELSWGTFPVIPETVGQYTGLKDKNGKKIYEGDIVKIGDFKYFIQFEIGSFMLVRCSDEIDMYLEFKNCWNDDVYPLSQLYWESDAEENTLYNCWNDDIYPLSQLYWESDAEENTLYNCEIIGNIYDNPELLEPKEDNKT